MGAFFSAVIVTVLGFAIFASIVDTARQERAEYLDGCQKTGRDFVECVRLYGDRYGYREPRP